MLLLTLNYLDTFVDANFLRQFPDFVYDHRSTYYKRIRFHLSSYKPRRQLVLLDFFITRSGSED